MSPFVTTPADLASPGFDDNLMRLAGVLKGELIRQAQEDLASWRKAVEVEMNRVYGPDAMANVASNADFLAIGEKIKTEYYEWVVPSFERYLMPDPDAANAAIDGLVQIQGIFQGGFDDKGNVIGVSGGMVLTNDVRIEMGHWEGTFSENFMSAFLTPLQRVATNQAPIAEGTRFLLECNRALYLQRRKSIRDLVVQATEAVKALKGSDNPKGFMWGTLIGSAVGAVLSGVSAVVTGGLTTPLIVAGVMASAGSSLMQGLVPSAAPQVREDLAAPTAQEVAVKITNAMNKIDNETLEAEAAVREKMRTLCDHIADTRSGDIYRNASGPFSVAAPALNDASPTDISTGGYLRPKR